MLALDTQSRRRTRSPVARRALRQRKLRFYAGAPLRSESGRPIGSLCIIDVRPRRITEREIALLQLLADEVMMIAQARQRPRCRLLRPRLPTLRRDVAGR